MKAWVLHGAGDLRLEQVRKPAPAEGEALVQVKAAGSAAPTFRGCIRTALMFIP